MRNLSDYLVGALERDGSYAYRELFKVLFVTGKHHGTPNAGRCGKQQAQSRGNSLIYEIVEIPAWKCCA